MSVKNVSEEKKHVDKIPHYRHSFLFHQDCKGRRQEVKPHSLIFANLFVCKEKDFFLKKAPDACT